MNHPVCAAKERALLIDGAANPSFEGREWNPSRNQPHSPFKGEMAAQRPGWFVKRREATFYARAKRAPFLSPDRHHPMIPIHQHLSPIRNTARRLVDSDNRGNAEFPRNDGGVAERAAAIGDHGAYGGQDHVVCG